MRAFNSIAVCLVSGFLMSCDLSPQDTGDLRLLQAELDQARAEQDMLRAKMESMRRDFERERSQCLDGNFEPSARLQELQDLRRQKSMLRSRCDSLQHRYKQLERWAKDLARGYGPGIWIYSDDHQWPLYGRKPRVATVGGIVDELNDDHRSTDSPLLILNDFDNGVVTLGVSDARKLATGMGSAGAISYILSAVYSLNSLPDVDCVRFEFEEGDHAAPGEFCS